MDELAQDAESGADLSDFGIDGAEYIKAMLGGFDYSIVSVNVAEDGQSATAIVNVTCKSFNAANDRANEISEEFAASDEITDMTDDLNKKIGGNSDAGHERNRTVHRGMRVPVQPC